MQYVVTCTRYHLTILSLLLDLIVIQYTMSGYWFMKTLGYTATSKYVWNE